MLVPLCSGQETLIEGRVIDGQSGDPLPFSTIAIIGTAAGSISNQDGQFRIEVGGRDTLEVRCTGFSSKCFALADIESSYFEIRLFPAISQLAEFTVIEADERALKYIDQAKKQLLKSGYTRSKAFLELFTEKDSLPTELLEVYYNADLRDAGIEGLEYKSGRVAVAPVNNSFFMSLSMSQVIQSHNPLNSAGFPESPFSLKRNEMNKLYDFKLIEFKSGEKTVYFDAKPANSESFFSGFFSIDEKMNVTEIEFSIQNPNRTPFIPLFETDSLRPLTLDIKWLYSQQETGVAPYLIDFNYSYVSAIPIGEGYTGPWLERRIQSDGLIYFYDFNTPFFSPEFSYGTVLNDYQKLLNTPFHEALWEVGRPFVESERFKRNQEFIAENGTLKNYRKQDEYRKFGGLQSVVDHSNVFWSDTARLRLNLIYHDPTAISGRTSTPRRQRFNLDVELYFDIIQVDSMISHFSQCIFDVYDSYYALESDSLTDLFLNLHFDLCEVERRKMEGSIASIDDISPKELLNLYELSSKRFNRATERYFRDTDSGSSLRALEKYNEELMPVTGVNNVELFLFPDAQELFQEGN
ncbi:carboxypeptidase-like regulatory domain-containing protein [Cryomorphaceae bacterium 1068]|nr:carboxypeptidase-like regulatory domain-containing protein [Cryomorphaceae bacterium 1068]